MSVQAYCLDVQRALLAKRPANPLENGWFADTGLASIAVTRALEHRDSKALAIAERLAQKWHLVVSSTPFMG